MVIESDRALLGTIKNFLERWCADADFRAEVEADPAAFTVREGVTAAELRPLYDRQAEGDASQAVHVYRAYVEAALRLRDEMEAGANPLDARFRAWRDRQLARTALQLGQERATKLRHLPAAFELSQGCSVGCWFCGVSAGKLEGHFAYTDENARLWRETLEALRAMIGQPAASRAFPYWATDPLDNPDFEKFCLDFKSVMGRFPGVTTALSLRDPERTRRLLALAREQEGHNIHFSVLSAAQFRRIQETFEPDLLLQAHLVPQFAGSNLRFSQSGRARSGKRTELLDPDPNTIACVSGFLLNMASRSLRLVTTCPADDRWPDGFWTLAETSFADGPDLRRQLDALAERHMLTRVDQLPRLAFARDFRWSLTDHGFRVDAPHGWFEFAREGYGPALRAMGQLLGEGGSNSGEIEMLLLYQHGVPESLTRATLESAFRRGILNEEPGL